MDVNNILEVVDLHCIRQRQVLFRELHFTLNPGTLLWIEGANGTGKSTLLRLLTGLTTPQRGHILWRHQPLQLSRDTYWQHLHYVSHQNGLKMNLTVHENLTLTATWLTQTSFSFESILSRLQLSHHQHTFVHQLSAGQQRRLALAKLFIFPKTVWILDEPFTALDSTMQTFFLSYLEKHLQQNGIAIISSHHAISFNKNISLQQLKLGN